MFLTGPPVLTVPSRPILSQNIAHMSAGEQSNTIGDAERMEENSKPKLKALHWDKVRTSSDRAMVWDQIKSSSFQYEICLLCFLDLSFCCCNDYITCVLNHLFGIMTIAG